MPLQINKTIMSKSLSRDSERKGPQTGIFSVLRSYSGRVSLLIFIALAGNAVNMIIPKIISRGIDDFTFNRFDFGLVIMEFSAASAAIFIFTFLQYLFQTYTSEKVALDMRTRVSDKISRQSYSFILQSNPSKLLTNLTSDIDSVKMFVSQAFVTIISSVFVLTGTSILLITINWKLALAMISIVPVIAFAFYFVFTRVKVLFRKSRENIDLLNKVINESILGSALIRVLNSQQPESTKFLKANMVSRKIGMSILKLFSVLVPVIMFVANAATVVILALGGHYVVAGTMTLGDFAAFNSYLIMLIFPIMMIGFMSNIIAQASASYQRITDVLNAPESGDKGTVSNMIRGDIRLKDVTLSYEEKPVLKNISFSINAGSKTAIIGPTAAGKSQLLYLLTGLIHPISGTIEFDGIDSWAYTRDLFFSQIGFVFQDSVIFNMTLRENIAFSDKVTDESIAKAIDTAELREFIDSLPDGLDTVVSERGTSLSGGQKQRIMLARALAIEPKVLLLDDFTSRVDRKTENRILCNLQNNYPFLTLISVTQKIAPVKHFEQIILIMEGEVIATGKHKELLENSTEYVQIYNSQRSTYHYEL
jgi:ATP-binding cassette, subfamily B, bacterial